MNKDILYKKIIYRFTVLRDKINFGLPLNDLDKKLIEILEEYDFLIDDIDYEQNLIKKNHFRFSKGDAKNE